MMMLPILVALITIVILSVIALYVYNTRTMSDDMQEVLAYTFKCDMLLEEIRQRLNANMPWKWR